MGGFTLSAVAWYAYMQGARSRFDKYLALGVEGQLLADAFPGEGRVTQWVW